MARCDNGPWVNWAELSPDLLRIISKKLCDISNFICFRAVCKSWRSATDRSDTPTQFPSLISWSCGKCSTLHLYSLASSKTHTFEVPNAYSFVGQSSGRVLVQSDRHNKYLYFLNPLTRATQTLPVGVPLHFKRPVRVLCNSRNDEVAVVTYAIPNDVMYFKELEKNQWSETIISESKAVVYYEHSFFVLESRIGNDRVVVIDETTRAEVSTISFPNKNNRLNYLIATTNGLLAINAFIPFSSKGLKNCQFEVHRLENYPQNPHWTKLSGIGDLMLFLDDWWDGFSLNANDFNGFKGNCIYFVTRGSHPRICMEQMAGRFDMELNKTEKIFAQGLFSKRDWDWYASWFMPTL